jgi:putative toxin-antitoxin system antitoxin component (TIGR02293 family)
MAKPEAPSRDPRSAVGEPADLVAYRGLLKARRGGGNSFVRLLGLTTYDPILLVRELESGLAYETFERLQRSFQLPHDEMAVLVQIKPRTLSRRRDEGRFNAEESDRLLRASRVFGRALALFDGDADTTRAWLATPAVALGQHTPLEIAASELGARQVEELIGRLEHGVFS